MIDYIKELQELYTEMSKLQYMKFIKINGLEFSTSKETFLVKDIHVSLSEVRNKIKIIYDSLEYLEYDVVADDGFNYEMTTVIAKTPDEARNMANEEFNSWYSNNELTTKLKDSTNEI